MDVALILAIVLGLVILWALLLLLFFIFRPKDVPVREVVALIPDLLRLLRSIITDGKAPIDVRIVLVVLVLWIVSPIDLIPEFIPVLGPIDDIVVAIIALRYTRRRLGTDDLRGRWRGTEAGFALLSRVVGSS